MADDFLDIHRKLSHGLNVKAEEAGILKHRSARGDGREAVFTEFLRQRIGAAFAVGKAEVVDSNGESSGELDVVVYDHTVSASLHDQGTRHVLRVETVAVVIEVRSHLEASSQEEEVKKIEASIGRLRRYFRPLPFLDMIFMTNPEAKKESELVLKNGLLTLETHQNIPRVVHAFFGYEGPAIETIEPFAAAAHVDIVCVNGKYTFAKERPGYDPPTSGPGAFVVGTGEDALGAFVEQIEQVLQRFRDARQYVTPGANYYSRARRKRAGTLT